MNEIKIFSKENYSLIRDIQNEMPFHFGCVYVLEFGESVKIGCSAKPYNRLLQHKANAKSKNCELGKIAILPNCRNYRLIEGYLHSCFEDCRISNTEYFEIDFDEAIEKISNRNIPYRFSILNTDEDDDDEDIKFVPWFLEKAVGKKVIEETVEANNQEEIAPVKVVEIKEPVSLDKEISKKDLYWQSKLNQLERRIEWIEAELKALRMNPLNNSECYTINEFAEALGISRLTVSRRIQGGLIKATKIGKTWRIPKTELEKIFDA